MKMLITDDDLISRNVLHAMLLPYGKCYAVADGAEALEAFEKAWREGKPFDVIFLDVQMPGMDGQETLKRIRTIEAEMEIAEEEKVKAVMVTGARDVKNVMAARESRCDAYLVKPVEEERILAEIIRLRLPHKKGNGASGGN